LQSISSKRFSRPAVIPTGELDKSIWDMLLRLTNVKKGGIPFAELKEPIIVAQRGRNPQNPSDRTTGTPTIQRLEPNTKGITNTLTTVQKDNYVCEFTSKKSYTLQEIFDGLSLRKLTEREYWRLMGWTDNQIDKVKNAGVSKSEMYRQAGNGICVPVLESIFRQLFCKTQITNTSNFGSATKQVTR